MPPVAVQIVEILRHASHSGQFYSEVTYNVAFGDDLHPERFLGVAPDREFKLLADLF